MDFPTKPGSDPGLQQQQQQQQGPVQETWGESRWEVIVLAPQQGEADPATPLTQHGHIKNSANAMHNRQADTEIQQLPQRLLGGTWHPIYKEHPCAGQNLYQWNSRYGLPPCLMQEPFVYNHGGGKILCNSRGGPCNKDKGREDGAGPLE
jgi:hypothetical protein